MSDDLPRSAARAPWPLTGRDAELAAIEHARATEGCRAVVLTAAAGVGKSRLAREVARRAADRDHALVEWVQATRSAAAVPLAAVAGLVPEDARGDDDALQLLRRSAQTLLERAQRRPVLVVVDDAQQLDPASAAFVLHLATTGAAFVLATVAAGEVVPDAITALWKEGHAERIDLDTLDDRDVRALVERALADPVEEAALRWVIEVARGNALYVYELVHGAVASGALAHEHGFWRLTGTPSATSSLIELVDRRLGGDGEREAIELLALGEPLRVTEMIALAGEDALLDAEARGLLATSGEDIRLAHPLYGEAVRLRLPPLRARRLRLRVAEALASRSGVGSDEALRIARLRLEAGADLAPELALEAAHAANDAGDPDLGAELARRALDHGIGLPAALVLARAHTMRNRHEQAEAVLGPAEPLAATAAAGNRVLAGEYVKQRANVLQWGLHRPQDVAALTGRAVAWSTERGWTKLLGRVRSTYGTPGAGVGDAAAAAAISADDRVAVESRRAAAALHALSLFVRGNGDEGAAAAWAGRPPVPLRDLGDAGMLSVLSLVTVEAFHRLDDVQAYAMSGLREGVRSEDRAGAGLSALTLARLALLRGAAHDATHWLAEADVHLRRDDPFGGRLQVEALRVGVYVATGAFEDAQTSLVALHTLAADHEPLAVRRASVARAEGLALRLRNDADAARALLDGAARFADELPGPAAGLAYEALRAGGHATAAPMLVALNERCASRAVAAYAAHASARAASDGEALAAVAAELAALGARRYAVEAASDAAAVHLADGRQDSARRAAATARELHLGEQGLDLPPIDGLDVVAIALTRREAQLVALAADGLTNADIADRLVLSVRTVETHLYRAMHKLGVSRRRDLRSPSADGPPR